MMHFFWIIYVLSLLKMCEALQAQCTHAPEVCDLLEKYYPKAHTQILSFTPLERETVDRLCMVVELCESDDFPPEKPIKDCIPIPVASNVQAAHECRNVIAPENTTFMFHWAHTVYANVTCELWDQKDCKGSPYYVFGGGQEYEPPVSFRSINCTKSSACCRDSIRDFEWPLEKSTLDTAGLDKGINLEASVTLFSDARFMGSCTFLGTMQYELTRKSEYFNISSIQIQDDSICSLSTYRSGKWENVGIVTEPGLKLTSAQAVRCMAPANPLSLVDEQWLHDPQPNYNVSYVVH
jgi:hypothetical protein